jgi:ubiquinone/menaquinone biosynthesis C-methylase UbiE
MQQTEKETGELFHKLWKKFTTQIFDQSLNLIFNRYKANNFDMNIIKNKKVLDAGCGSGRHVVASAYLGAKKVIGIDISKKQIDLNKKNFKSIKNIDFKHSSTDRIKFANNYFDYVISSGVIHHTKDYEKSLDEVVRVCKKGGKIFLLIYGAGGFRWPIIKALRPMAKKIGIGEIKKSMKISGLPLNNIKHFTDDLFVPIQKITQKKEIIKMLKEKKVKEIKFWSSKKTFDHEFNFKSYLNEFKKLKKIFLNVEKDIPEKDLAMKIINIYIQKINTILKKKISIEKKRQIIIGEGNHRILITK